MEKIIKVKLSELKEGFYVREKINEDYVLMLASLIEGGVKLPPIEITEDKKIIEGRHRKRAHEFLDKEEIDAIVKKTKDKLELISGALASNLGGNLPPTKEDIVHCIKTLVKEGYSQPKIINSLSAYLPQSMLRVLHKRATSEIFNSRVWDAVMLIKENMTIKQAAEKVGIPMRYLQEALDRQNGNGKKKNLNFKAIISQRFTNLNKGNGHTITSMVEGYKDGVIQPTQISDTIGFLGKMVSNTDRLFRDWQNRFAKLVE